MFDIIWNALKDECGMAEMNAVLHGISQLAHTFELELFQDKDAKNAAIDAICQILQQHKDV